MSEFKVMTWNVENLYSPNATDSAAKAAFNAKIKLLAKVIKDAGPDVVAFQEIGGLEPLQALQTKLGAGYKHLAISQHPDHRGIRVAFLSKIAITEQEDIVDFPAGPALAIQNVNGSGDSVPVTAMGRGALRIRVDVDGTAVDIITAHLKSKLLTYPRPGGSSFTPRDENERAQIGGIALHRRAAEAVTLRIRANDMLAGNDKNRLILLDDFNDVPEAQTSLLMIGPSGSEIGTRGFKLPDKGDDTRLFNLAPAINASRRYSRIQSGRKEMLDQIFISVDLFALDANGKRVPPVADSLVDFAESLQSVGENPNLRVSEIAPDHAPVMATLDI
jgi:hypothetical protein